MARLFSMKQKNAVEIVTGMGGQADHIVPHSRGGETKVENCQMIAGKTNRRKGTFVYKPWDWQKQFQDQWDARRKKSFLLMVIPGGGKTLAALAACRKWMDAGNDRRIVVVVPTNNLQEQWRDEAVKFGIDLHTKEFGTNFKHGFQGGVTTYSFVANNSALLRKLCSSAPTMVVLDEIHHCGDEAHFGRGVVEAFDLAEERLLLSGTPWKTDGTPIPYVTYNADGYAVGDFSYDYRSALNDSVIRYLVFDYSRGTITNDVTGKTDTLSSEATEDESSLILRRLLDPTGEFVREQIRRAHKQLMEIRKTIPDAGAMAACIDQTHAASVAEMIRSVTGCSPGLIVSDEGRSTENVREFRRSSREWLVAVRKVSEGTDIKRLQVLCYLTNTVSELFFRQLIGRVSRVRKDGDDQGFVFLPADPRLILCAQNIEEAQRQCIREKEEGEKTGGQADDWDEKPSCSYSTGHDGTELVTIGGEAVPSDQAEKIRQASEAVGVPMQKVLQLSRFLEGFELRAYHDPAALTKEEEMDALRKKCSKAARQMAAILARKTGGELDQLVKQVHRQFRPQASMTEDELRRKLDTILKEISNA